MSTLYNHLSLHPTEMPPTNPAEEIHTLNVGGRLFTTTRATLSESPYLTDLISAPQPPNDIPTDHHFIDADPVTFDHILRYLRSGVFPVFYTTSTGHDHCMYLSLLQDARYFQIMRLVEWLEEKRYLDAVKTVFKVEVWGDVVDTVKRAGGDEEVQWFVDFVDGETEDEWVRRPRGVVVTKRTIFDDDCCLGIA